MQMYLSFQQLLYLMYIVCILAKLKLIKVTLFTISIFLQAFIVLYPLGFFATLMWYITERAEDGKNVRFVDVIKALFWPITWVAHLLGV